MHFLILHEWFDLLFWVVLLTRYQLHIVLLIRILLGVYAIALYNNLLCDHCLAKDYNPELVLKTKTMWMVFLFLNNFKMNIKFYEDGDSSHSMKPAFCMLKMYVNQGIKTLIKITRLSFLCISICVMVLIQWDFYIVLLRAALNWPIWFSPL